MRSSTWLLALGLIVPLLVGCGSASTGSDHLGSDPAGTGENGAPPMGGMLRIAVTDDPFPIDAVLEASVEIGRVEAHVQELDAWVVLSEETFTVNLVGLSNGIVEEIVDVAVDPGTYDKFRFITGLGRVVLDPDKATVADESRLQEVTIDGELRDGYVFTVEDGGVKFPSGPQTGIKVNVDPPIVVTTGLSGDLLLEFDLGRNFVFNGPTTHKPGVKRVLFTPSVKASNETTNGSVAVVINSDEILLEDDSDDLPLEGAEVWLVDDAGTKVTQTFSAADGMAVLSATPGTYTLKADKFGFVEGEIASVEIVLANLKTEDPLALVPSDLVVTGTVYTDAGTSGETETDDDYPIAGVAVTLHLASSALSDAKTTDSDGLFTFERLEEFTYDLTFSKVGFTTFDTTWAPADGPMTVRLNPLRQAVAATIKDGDDAAVASATVTATDEFGNEWTATTNSSGEAAFTLPTGTYTFTATDGTDTYVASDDLDVVGDDSDATSDAITLAPDAS